LNILVWQTAFLGDLILTTPLIASLKNLYPQSKITLVAKGFARAVFQNNPHLDNLLIYEKKENFFSFIQKLKKARFDLAISPHRSHRASLALFLSKIPQRIGFDRAGFSFLYTKTFPHAFDGTHEIERNLSLLQGLSTYAKNKLVFEPRLYLTSKEKSIIQTYGLTYKDYLLIAPGSKWPTKRWTRQGFQEVISYWLKKKVQVVLIGDREDAPFATQITTGFNSPLLLNLVGKTSLRESFGLIKGARVILSNDSAPVHMAQALNTPAVVVFGPTITAFGFYPYKLGKVLEVPLKCRPCGLHGHKACPQKHHHCMQQIEVSQVIASLENFWEKNL